MPGRTEEEIIKLIPGGTKASGKKATHETIPKETGAIKHAISIAKEGTFIAALSDVVTKAISRFDKEAEE